jgi:hypothetical protein
MRRYPWTAPVAGVLLLLAGAIVGISAAADADATMYGLALAATYVVVGLGLLARRRWAVLAGLGLSAINVGLTVLAFSTGPAGWLTAEFTVLLLLLLLPALWRRRSPPPRQRAGRTDRWNGRRQRLLFWLAAVPTVLIGMAFFLVVPFGWLAGGVDPVAALVVLGCLAFFGSVTALLRPRPRTVGFDVARLSIGDEPTPAFLARYDRVGRAMVPVGAAGVLAVLSVWLLAAENLQIAVRLPGAVLAGLVALAALALPATGWRSYVALLPSGLHVPGLRHATFAPWRAIGDSSVEWIPHRAGAEPYVTVSVDPAAMRTSGGGRLLWWLHRGFGADLYFPARMLVTDPDFLAYAIGAYGARPERGRMIGMTEELDRLRSEWSGSRPSRQRPDRPASSRW